MSEHFYVWRFKWKKWLTIIGCAMAAAIFLWFQQVNVWSVFSGEKSSILGKGNKKEPNISLTFNISWGEERAHDILKQLKEHQVQATFFVSGEWAERHPDIVEKIVEGKHELGMLGYRYKNYVEQEVDQVRRDLQHAKEVFTKLGYKDISLLRTPSGHFNEEIIKLAGNLGLQVVHWNQNPNDWQNPGQQKIVDHLMKHTSNGDIILLHASDAVKQTANALKTVLPGLKNKGFTFVTITELINQADAKAKIVD